MTNNNCGDWNNSPAHKKSTTTKTIVFGLMVIVFGLALLLNNTGYLSPEVSDNFFSWPMILVAVGILNFFGQKKWFGTIVLIIGVFFLIDRNFPDLLLLHTGKITLKQIFWPLLVIILGLGFIFNSSFFKRKNRINVSETGDDVLDEVSVFGGAERIITAQNFQGGRITAVFGGSKIDLRNARLSEGNNLVEINVVFGGTQLIVPSDWNVKIEVINIFGGFVDKRSIAMVDSSKTLQIRGLAIFGGGEVKNMI